MHQEQLLYLTKKIGAPFFLYDCDALSTHIQALSHWPVSLWYALKANPLSSIIQTLHTQGMKADVASIGELDQALASGIPANNILHTGPAKSMHQLQYFLEKGIRIFIVESHQQLKDLNTLCQQQKQTAQVLLRVQLSWESAHNNVLGGICITPFGLTPTEWENCSLQKYTAVDIFGLHCFQWGNITELSTLSAIWEYTSNQLIQLAKNLKINCRVIDLGGGLGIPYDHKTPALTPSEIHEALQQLTQRYAHLTYWMELGRYAVGPFGEYAVEVIDRKTVQDNGFLVLAGGINHLLRQNMTGQHFPVRLLRKSQAPFRTFHCHGPLCTSMDKLATVSLPEDTFPGDWLVFSQTGAYGFTESMPFFLCHHLPAEAIIKNGNTHIVRETQGAHTTSTNREHQYFCPCPPAKIRALLIEVFE